MIVDQEYACASSTGHEDAAVYSPDGLFASAHKLWCTCVLMWNLRARHFRGSSTSWVFDMVLKALLFDLGFCLDGGPVMLFQLQQQILICQFEYRCRCVLFG